MVGSEDHQQADKVFYHLKIKTKPESQSVVSRLVLPEACVVVVNLSFLLLSISRCCGIFGDTCFLLPLSFDNSLLTFFKRLIQLTTSCLVIFLQLRFIFHLLRNTELRIIRLLGMFWRSILSSAQVLYILFNLEERAFVANDALRFEGDQ